MIELKRDRLHFSFPEVHKQAKLTVELQRTLRIPDDDRTYPLPPGLGNFPLCHVDDHASNVPQGWRRRGGVMMPMYQSEALWINFKANFVSARGHGYPFAIKIATGKVCAVTGEGWQNELSLHQQDYVVAPTQPWLDGYCVEKNLIRQFVAMPLGAGYSAEEQITGEAEHGGIQIIAYPMLGEEFEKRFPFSKTKSRMQHDVGLNKLCLADVADMEMGLAPGGKMRQEIAEDKFGFGAWDHNHSSRCFIHMTNSLVWQSVTGKRPPQPSPTAKTYSQHGLPWFDYYSESPALNGSKKLSQLKTVHQVGIEMGQKPLPENETAVPINVNVIAPQASKYQVREGEY